MPWPEQMRLDAFFRACVRLHDDPDGRDVLVAAARELEDSESLLTAIEAQQVGPLLHRMIGDAGILSPLVANAVRESYHRTARRTLLRFDELAACLRALGAVGVPVVVLKGAALIETLYDNIALRPMGDVDLLVRRSDLATTHRTLAGLGHALAGMETHPGALVEYENELTLRKPGHRPWRSCVLARHCWRRSRRSGKKRAEAEEGRMQ